jgi:protein phosphatase
VRSGSATDVGRVRKVNQDLSLESANLFAVADGMGGHVGGEVAARLAVDALHVAFDRVPTASGLRDAIGEANRAVWQESQSNPDVRGMGTTLTAVALVAGVDGRDTLALGNVGDSRAYVLSGRQFVQVTADHSLAEERVRQGELTEAEAAVHPQRHILTRALGIAPEVDADMWELQLQSGDRVVLCSDGLSNEVSTEEMGHVLVTEADPQTAARQLVDLANQRGGSDNITVVVVDVLVGEEGDSPSSVITPVGIRAGAALVLAAGIATGTGGKPSEASGAPDALTAMVPAVGSEAATMAVPVVDSLAPGAQLGFSGQGADLGDGAKTGEFLVGQTATGVVPLARTSMRVPPRPVVPRPTPLGKESRGARRRRLGIPRRITVRVILFVLMVAAVPVGAFFAIRWYAYDNWYLGLQGKQIIIRQGHPQGVLWFKSKVVDHTGVSTTQVLPPGLAQVKAGVQEPSLSDAQHYVANLHAQYVFLHSAAQNGSGSGANSIGPSGSIPNITAPPPTCTTTTTAAGATAAPPTTTCTPPSTVPGQITVPPPTAPTTTTTTAPPVTTTTVALP